jgi:hypothetical protein
MNLSFSFPSTFRETLLSAGMNFSADNGGPDTFKAILMREGFSFNSTNHLMLNNVSSAGTTGAINYTVALATRTITASAPVDFTSYGFAVGNYIKTNGSNSGVYVVRSVSALSMRIDAVSGSIANETAVGKTITCDDEYPDGIDGYTRGGGVVTIGFSLDGSNLYLDAFNLTAFGAALERSPGAIIYDDSTTVTIGTATGKPIVCYARFSPWALSF